MGLQKYKILVILYIVLIILGPFLQVINVDTLIHLHLHITIVSIWLPNPLDLYSLLVGRTQS